MADVLELFPGAGTTPAPGPRATPADMDAVGERYTALLEARETGPTSVIVRLSSACADDVPVLVAEVARVERLRAELAAEIDQLRGELAEHVDEVDQLTALVDAYRLTEAAHAVLDERGDH